jgi:hypothetical protein
LIVRHGVTTIPHRHVRALAADHRKTSQKDGTHHTDTTWSRIFGHSVSSSFMADQVAPIRWI